MERDCVVGTDLGPQETGFSTFPFGDFPFEISPAVGQQKMN